MWPRGTLLLGMLLLRARPHAVRSPSLMESQCAGTLLTVLAEPSLQATPAQAPDVSVRKLPDASRSKLWSPQPLESFQMRPQAFCTLNNFQTHRIWEHDKWRLLYATKLGLVCYAALSSWDTHHDFGHVTSMCPVSISQSCSILSSWPLSVLMKFFHLTTHPVCTIFS